MSKTLKFALIGIVVLVLGVIAVITYRMFFQFNSSFVKQYAQEEAAKYANKEAAYKYIMDSVEYILSSHNLSQQVLKTAKVNNSDKEQELVFAAVNQCKAFKYL